MIEWWNTEFDKSDADAAHRAISSNYINEGKITRGLEKDIQEFLCVKHAHLVPSGTVALTIALMSVGVVPGDEVIIPDITFIATANSIALVGARPVLCDVNDDLNISVQDIERKITNKTKAIIAVHINGNTCNYLGLKKISEQFNIPIIEDTSQGLGSNSKHGYLGTLFDIGTYSLAPSKIISTGQGGIVVTNDSSLSEKIIRMKDHGRLARSELEHPAPGYNFKFTDLQAAIGSEQFKKLPSRLRKAQEDYDFYQGQLSKVSQIHFTGYDKEFGSVPLWVDIRVKDRQQLIEHLNLNNIYPRPIWRAMHKDWIGGQDESFPSSSRISEEVLWLPSGPTISAEKLEIVAREILRFYEEL